MGKNTNKNEKLLLSRLSTTI